MAQLSLLNGDTRLAHAATRATTVVVAWFCATEAMCTKDVYRVELATEELGRRQSDAER